MMGKCQNCRHWGFMGKCAVRSGVRVAAGVRWHQISTTEPNDSCESFARLTLTKEQGQ